MQVIVDEQVIHYERVGHGKTIVLVHGWGNSLVGFYDLQSSLAEHYEVIAMDLPGFGQSGTPIKAWTIDDYSLFLKKFCAKLKIDVFAFVGHSNGGAILINGLSTKKLNSKKLILISSAGIRDQDKFKKRLLKTTAKSGKVLTAILPKPIRRGIKGRFYKSIGSDYLIVPHMQETFREIVSYDIQAEAAKLKLPTLLIYGSEDRDAPPRFGELLHKQIVGSKYKLIDNSGHFPHHDQPALVESTIKGFLNA